MLKRFGCRVPIQMVRTRYLSSLVEQDHRFIKRRMRPMLGFKKLYVSRVDSCMHRVGEHDPFRLGLRPFQQF